MNNCVISKEEYLNKIRQYKKTVMSITFKPKRYNKIVDYEINAFDYQYKNPIQSINFNNDEWEAYFI